MCVGLVRVSAYKGVQWTIGQIDGITGQMVLQISHRHAFILAGDVIRDKTTVLVASGGGIL